MSDISQQQGVRWVTQLDRVIEGHDYRGMDVLITVATTTQPAHVSRASVNYLTNVAKDCESSADYDISCDKLLDFVKQIKSKAVAGAIIIVD